MHSWVLELNRLGICLEAWNLWQKTKKYNEIDKKLEKKRKTMESIKLRRNYEEIMSKLLRV